MMQQRPSRPDGITILAVLEILIGVIGLLSALTIIGFAVLLTIVPAYVLLGTVGFIIGGILLIFSAIWLATGLGFLHGRGWSWTLGVIFSVLSILGSIGAIVAGLYTGGLAAMIFWGLIIYYLTRNHVKAFFGKTTFPMSPSYQLSYSAGPQFNQPQIAGNNPSYAQTITTSMASKNSPNTAPCPYCKTRLTPGSPKCLNCGAAI